MYTPSSSGAKFDEFQDGCRWDSRSVFCGEDRRSNLYGVRDDSRYPSCTGSSVPPSSTVKINTLTPVWNETWRVKNVPITSDLYVEVLDKDVGAPIDDYIGKFKTSVAAGAKEQEIEGPLFRRDRGTFWLKVRIVVICSITWAGNNTLLD